MFVSSGQFYVFLACFSIGALSGVFLSLSCALKRLIKLRAVRIVCDVTAFVLITLFYIFSSYLLKFPTFRWYMVVGVLLGIVAYMKSFNIILAKLFKISYNKIVISKKSKR